MVAPANTGSRKTRKHSNLTDALKSRLTCEIEANVTVCQLEEASVFRCSAKLDANFRSGATRGQTFSDIALISMALEQLC